MVRTNPVGRTDARKNPCKDPHTHVSFQCTSTHLGEQLCKLILKSILKYRSYGPENSGRTDERIEVTLWRLCLAHRKQAR